MRRQGWKVPTVFVAAALVGACGGEAESAADAESERVIPAAEAADPPAQPPEASIGPVAEPATPDHEPAATDAPATPELRSSRPESTPAISPRPDEPVADPPTAVERTDPEPSVTPAEPIEARPEALPPAPEPLAAPVGTPIVLTVEDELSTKVSTTGDTFDATVFEDVLGADGVVLLPRGTRVRGLVLESFESPASDRPATLALGVESVELADRLIPVVATVTELEHETEARDSGGRSAAKVGAGAVAGALLGKIIGGDGGDAVKGAVAGAVAGAAVAHATRDGHARVPQGARMVIVLDERLVVEPPAPGGPDR